MRRWQCNTPPPLKTEPKNGTAFYIPNPMRVGQKCTKFYWNDTHFDRAWLKRGMVYATKADAEAACDLMLAALKGGAA